MVGYGPLVDTRVTLTFSGTGAVVSDATTQALTGTNIRGNTGANTAQGVHSLWRIGVGGQQPDGQRPDRSQRRRQRAPGQPADAYFGTTAAHRQGTGSTERHPVARGHGVLHVQLRRWPGGQRAWDRWECRVSATPAGVCCTSACLFACVGDAACRGSAGVCDVAENCTGLERGVSGATRF